VFAAGLPLPFPVSPQGKGLPCTPAFDIMDLAGIVFFFLGLIAPYQYNWKGRSPVLRVPAEPLALLFFLFSVFLLATCDSIQLLIELVQIFRRHSAWEPFFPTSPHPPLWPSAFFRSWHPPIVAFFRSPLQKLPNQASIFFFSPPPTAFSHSPSDHLRTGGPPPQLAPRTCVFFPFF